MASSWAVVTGVVGPVLQRDRLTRRISRHFIQDKVLLSSSNVFNAWSVQGGSEHFRPSTPIPSRSLCRRNKEDIFSLSFENCIISLFLLSLNNIIIDVIPQTTTQICIILRKSGQYVF